MTVDLLYITYNRIECTKQTLPKLLDSSEYPFNLTIVDNASCDGTVQYLKEITASYQDRQNINLQLNKHNQGLSVPTNIFWQKSAADLVGKIDNDIYVESGWLKKLVYAHEQIPELAVIGGFHFPENIFNEKKCRHNICQYNGVKIIRQTHIGGNYLAKKEYISENGLLKEPSSDKDFKLGGWTAYQERLTKKGYIIAYHFPLIIFKHLDTADKDYYKRVRGMSARKYFKWEKKIGKKMLYSKRQW
ncbi:MAG: glycosyltransferase family 2 protein [Desulfococcaceae bacterium]|jgi:glycosyltransferase involved in cell wall biosynthesis|nr:glycosyltransferase family 2 protein [Desulfococcaceae bacterium]